MRNKFLGIGAILALGTFASADIVLDHITGHMGANSITVVASQDFGAANDPFDIIVIEDFTVTGAQTTVTMVEAIMGGFAGFANANFTNGAVTGYHIEFFTSVAAAGASLTGDAGSVLVAPGGANVSAPLAGYLNFDSLVSIPINVVLPGAGTYWVGIQPVMDFAGNGQVGINEWLPGTYAGGDDAWQANPNGGFNFPGGVQQRSADSAYRVNAVPEPASMIALAMGAAALVARRRRKKTA